MAVLSPAQIKGLAEGAGVRGQAAVIATAIALAESGGKTDARNDGDADPPRGWGPSVGLWQVRSRIDQQGTGGERDASRLYDPMFNARSMATISNGGTNWQPWSVFSSGRYREHLGAAQSAVSIQPAEWWDPRDWPYPPGLDPFDPIPDVPGLPDGSNPLDTLRNLTKLVDLLLDRRTWIRAMQIIGGAVLILVGVLILNRDALMGAAQFVPGAGGIAARAASAVKGAAGS